MLEKKYLGVEIKLTEDGYSVCRATLTVQQNKKASIVWMKEITTLEELQEYKQATIIVGITGKGILIKNNDYTIDTIQDALQLVLPNSNLTDFYVQKTTINSGTCIAVVRKEKMNKIIQDFISQGFFVSDIYIAPLAIKLIEVLFSQEDNYKIEADAFQIKVTNGKLIDIEKHTANNEIQTDNNISIAGFKLTNAYVISFALAFSQLIDKENAIDSSILPLLEQQRDQFQYRNKIKNITVSLSVFLLLLLFANLLSNLYLQNKINKQEPVVLQYANRIKEKEQLKEQLTFIKKTYGSHTSGITRTTFYADRLAAAIPQNMKLSALYINPFFNEREKDSLLFYNNTIKITGQINNANEFNEWLASIQKQTWCKKIKEQNFEQNVNQNSGKFNVRIDVE